MRGDLVAAGRIHHSLDENPTKPGSWQVTLYPPSGQAVRCGYGDTMQDAYDKAELAVRNRWPAYKL